MQASEYPKIEEDDRGWFYLDHGDGVETCFDEIVATGCGYWDLRLDGLSVATVRSIDDWDGDTTRKFRAIQFGEVTA